MGRRKPRQEPLFITADQLTPTAGHPFYQRLNQLLDEARFDRWIAGRCVPHYEQTETRGQPSLPPGVDFRMVLLGYFEGLDSQRGIAWRCSDSLSLRALLGVPLGDRTPDHSTLTRTRKRLPTTVFDEVFQFVLGISVAERAMRPLCVGRANCLQIGGDAGLATASVLLSPCATAARHRLTPWAYLTDVLNRLAARPAAAELPALLPDAWAAHNPSA